MKIQKIKLLNHGMRGLFVKYEDEKDIGGMKFKNDYKVDYRMPVTPEIRTILIGLEDGARDVLKLEKGTSVSVIGIVGNAEGYQLMCQVRTYDNLEYNVLSPFFDEETEYGGFGDVSEKIEDLYGRVDKYVQGGMKINSKQVLLDFQAYGDEKVKKSMEDLNLESMSEADAIAKATEYLERAGCLVSLPDEFSEDVEVSEDF